MNLPVLDGGTSVLETTPGLGGYRVKGFYNGGSLFQQIQTFLCFGGLTQQDNA